LLSMVRHARAVPVPASRVTRHARAIIDRLGCAAAARRV